MMGLVLGSPCASPGVEMRILDFTLAKDGE
jgi:hypothetical protein